jgi:hypothetical protein
MKRKEFYDTYLLHKPAQIGLKKALIEKVAGFYY